MTTETYDYYFEEYGLGVHCRGRKNKSYIHVTESTVIFYKVDVIEKWHRLDGPAYISRYNDNEWWINDICYTEQIHEWAKDQNIDLKNLTEVDKALIKITWANVGNI